MVTPVPTGCTVRAATTINRGRGRRSYTVTLSRPAAEVMADYLWSVAEVAGVGEGRDSGVASAARVAVARLELALKG